MTWWNILIFGVVPVFSVVIIFMTKRKSLWTAPLISTALAFLCYLINLAPITIVEVFSNNEWRAFYILAMLMQFGITVVITAIAYFAVYILIPKK